MGDKITPLGDLTNFEQELKNAVQGMRSIEAIEEWLNAQQAIMSVQVRNYLIKTHPPQREIIVEFKGTGEGNSVLRKIITIYEIEPQTFQFHQLRDA